MAYLISKDCFKWVLLSNGKYILIPSAVPSLTKLSDLVEEFVDLEVDDLFIEAAQKSYHNAQMNQVN